MQSPRRSKRKSSSILSVLLICVLFQVSGALASEEVIYKGPRGVKAAEKQLHVSYVYNPVGKTDPFKSFIAEQEPVDAKKRKPRTYLETLDISQLELIAIIIGPKVNWAMVRDAKGLGHVIKEGTPIGLYEGVVHEIKEKEVIIREKHKDFRGKVKFKNISKKISSLQ